MLKKEARAIAVSLSDPSKMPGKAWGISPSRCKVGGKLRGVEGSTCSDCYACKGQYRLNNVKAAHEARYQAMRNDPQWVDAMVRLVQDEEYFRWHDAGDLQDADHLKKIIAIVEQTPNTMHWLPTREKALVHKYQSRLDSLPNLVVRVSAAMVDGKPPHTPFNTSTVHDQQDPQGYRCPAPDQGGECGQCRACWDKSVKNVSYNRH